MQRSVLSFAHIIAEWSFYLVQFSHGITYFALTDKRMVFQSDKHAKSQT